MKKLWSTRVILALLLIAVLLAAVVPTTFAQDPPKPDGCMNSTEVRPECGGGGYVPRDPEPEPGGIVTCPGEPNLQPDLYINGDMVCGLYPRPYLQDGRYMYALRAVSEALERSGQGKVVLDYWVVPEADGSRSQYVSVVSRSRELLFRLGSRQVRVWATNPENGERHELDSIWMSVPAVAIDGFTRLPVRYLIEGLGGTVDGWNPYVTVTYRDNNPTPHEIRLAEAIAPGSLGAYRRGLLTKVEFLWLADYSLFWAEMGRQNSKDIPMENPVAYIRSQTLLHIVNEGRRPTDDDYEFVARVAAFGLGTNVTPQEVRRTIAKTGEENMRTVARIIGLEEYGKNPYTGETVSFKEYNDLKSQNPSWNGPDGIYVVTNAHGFILFVLIAESKATARPWVSPYRFETNAPLQDQLANLKQWKDPTVRKAATELDSMVRELDRLKGAGEITAEEHAQRLQVLDMDFATSAKGGISKGYAEARKAAGKSYASMDMAGKVVRIFRAWAGRDKEP